LTSDKNSLTIKPFRVESILITRLKKPGFINHCAEFSENRELDWTPCAYCLLPCLRILSSLHKKAKDDVVGKLKVAVLYPHVLAKA
jgi:hypothetical protein